MAKKKPDPAPDAAPTPAAPPPVHRRAYVDGESLTLRATVVSARDRGNIVIDVGGKTVIVPQEALERAGG